MKHLVEGAAAVLIFAMLFSWCSSYDAGDCLKVCSGCVESCSWWEVRCKECKP